MGKKNAAILLMVVALTLTSTGAMAQNLKVLGFDDNSCKAWQGSSGDPELRAAQVAWARGFLSGHNYANQRQQVSEVSRSTVEMFIDRSCREKPTAQFTEAVYRMSDQYAGRSGPISR